MRTDVAASPRAAKYLEGAAYLELLEQRAGEWCDADFVGTLSYRALDKIDLPADLPAVCARCKEAGAETIALLPLPEVMLRQALLHPRFLEVWIPLTRELGFPDLADSLDPDTRAFASNYWLATPARMAEYCAFFRAAARVLETHAPMQGALWSDAMYRNHFGPERCRQVFGVPHIPYHPFVCERLPCFYFRVRGIKLFIVPAANRRWWLDCYGHVPEGVVLAADADAEADAATDARAET